MAPDKIYVREFAEGLNQMWSSIIATETSAIAQHEYIRKETLLEWLKAAISEIKGINYDEANYEAGEASAYDYVIEHLNEM